MDAYGGFGLLLSFRVFDAVTCRLGHGSCFALPCFFAESWTVVPVFSLDLGRHAVSRCRVARSLVGLTGSCRWLLTSSTPRAVLVPRLQISGLSSSSSTFVASACFKGPVVSCLPSVYVLYYHHLSPDRRCYQCTSVHLALFFTPTRACLAHHILSLMHRSSETHFICHRTASATCTLTYIGPPGSASTLGYGTSPYTHGVRISRRCGRRSSLRGDWVMGRGRIARGLACLGPMVRMLLCHDSGGGYRHLTGIT
jgi:hypothetical protein